MAKITQQGKGTTDHFDAFRRLVYCISLLLYISFSLYIFYMYISFAADLEGRTVSTSEAVELANELGFSYVETSAATGLGVDEAFHRLLQLVMKRVFKMEEEDAERRRDSTKMLSIQQPVKKKGCSC